MQLLEEEWIRGGEDTRVRINGCILTQNCRAALAESQPHSLSTGPPRVRYISATVYFWNRQLKYRTYRIFLRPELYRLHNLVLRRDISVVRGVSQLVHEH